MHCWNNYTSDIRAKQFVLAWYITALHAAQLQNTNITSTKATRHDNKTRLFRAAVHNKYKHNTDIKIQIIITLHVGVYNNGVATNCTRLVTNYGHCVTIRRFSITWPQKDCESLQCL